MDTRQKADQWLRQHMPGFRGPFHASRFYQPHQSWTKHKEWAFNVPYREFDTPGRSAIALLCEHEDAPGEFNLLLVPASVFVACKHLLYGRDDIKAISLFLSAEPNSRFREERGKGQLRFSAFLEDA